MSIKIHHGAPGSYKTSGAVADDFLPAVKQGRVVITNVRGLTLDRVKNAKYPLTFVEKYFKRLPEPYKLVFPEIAEGFDVLHFDTRLSSECDKLARFFHWAPIGSEEKPGPLFLIDEAQSIFSPRWTSRDIAALDFPGGRDAAGEAHRPATWDDAWTMHRHYGWDFTLSTPNIKLIRDDIRLVSEGGFKHRNLGVIGLRGRYMEGFHDAQDSGQSASHFLSLSQKRIPNQVWGLYDSTTTGTFTDTLAGISIFKDPKVMGLVALLAVALGVGWYGFSNSSLYKAGVKAGGNAAPAPVVAISPPSGGVPPQKNIHPPAPDLSGHVANSPPRPADGVATLPPRPGESEWGAVGYYTANGKNYVVLQRNGVKRVVVNPKGADYDGNRVEFKLNGLLVAGYTGTVGGSAMANAVKP
jgi:zona occludens toxin